MGSKDRLMACSAPAGPALEGAQIRHGMRGAVGAVEAVRIDDDVHCSVIGSARAIGICGSGLIDACAKMVGAGVMDGMGRLGPPDRERLPGGARGTRLRTGDAGVEFVLVWDADAGKNEDVTLTQGDIRQLQLAKSAIWSGIVLLQRVMGIDDADLAELMLCGGFGNYINTESAVAIRLLPDVPLDRISYVGNAAHLGAQMALLSERERTPRRGARPAHRARGARRAPGLPGHLHRRDVVRERGAGRSAAHRGGNGAAKDGSGMSDLRINLLFGFLGSGKTTLLRRILGERAGERKMAVIVNEFGDVGVDGEVIAGSSVNLVELTSGCLCCTLRGSLMSAVEELREKAAVEQIVVEATGVASPGDMLEDLNDSRSRTSSTSARW